MAIYPEPDPEYLPPPMDECEPQEAPWVLALNHELRIKYYMWQQQYMVKLAIIQICRINGEWQQMARIDTCHSMVHHHQLRRGSDDDQGIIRDLEKIPAERGWEVIDGWYMQGIKLMQNDWREHVRRWGGDGS